LPLVPTPISPACTCDQDITLIDYFGAGNEIQQVDELRFLDILAIYLITKRTAF